MSSMIAAALCFIIITPSAAFGAALPEKEKSLHEAGKPAETENTAAADAEDITKKLPAYALYEDGTPNSAFVDLNGNLQTVSPEMFKEILADWTDPVIDTEGMPTVLELLGHIPANPESAIDIPSGEESIPSDISPMGISPFMDITPMAVDFPYFFHLAGQTDPFGSGHSYRQYYVPAGSDVPLLSFCLEMGKNAPPDSVKVAYTQMGAPGWSTALATFAPAVLRSYGIDTISDNAERQWAMQDAVWALQGSSIGSAASVPVIRSLVNAARDPVSASSPKFNGIENENIMKAELFRTDLVRYGPFSITGMSGNAELIIYSEDGNPNTGAWLGDVSGAKLGQSVISGDTEYYIYIPRYLYSAQRISIRINAPYILPSTMNAYQAPSSGYQNQIVMTGWTPRSGTVTVTAKLGGFGEFEISKLDTGWRPDYSEEMYLLEGAKFKIQEWTSGGFTDTSIPVTYDSVTRTYRTGYLFETNANGGVYRVIETGIPYGYRDPVIVDAGVTAKYGLKHNGPSDAGTLYAKNNLLNVRIEIQKRDKAGGASGPALPQGNAALSGAYYGLFYSEAITDPSGIRHYEDEMVCIGITDESGKVVFDNSDAVRVSANSPLIWGNDDTDTNYGTEDFPIYLPVFERLDRRIYPAKYYVQELVPSKGYLLDTDPLTAELDSNGIPLPGTGSAFKYFIDASDDGSEKNPYGIQINTNVTEQVKMRGFLLRKIRSDGDETEVYSLNGAGFSVYLIEDLIGIIQKASESDSSIKVPLRGPGGWDKQDFIDFFYDADYENPIDTGHGKPWYNHDDNVYKGRYNFDLYPELMRARIDFLESPVFYSGADLIPGLRYGKYGNMMKPDDGEVVFPEFPYGEYIVFETYTPPGVDRIKPFVVNIKEDGGDITDGDGIYNADRPEQTWRIQVDSNMFSIRLWKKDAETGKTVIGKDAAFRIKYLGADGVEGGADDRWVEMVIPEKNGIVRYGTAENPFRVGEHGTLILPRKLMAGAYKLYEVSAPSGYVLSYHEAIDGFEYYYADPEQIQKRGYGDDKEAILYTPKSMTPDPQPDAGIVFDINEAHRVPDFDIDTDGYDDFVLELVQYNEQQKGRINIHKVRETEEGRLSAFSGVTFELLAAEDILSLDGHGSVIFRKGEFVANAETNSSGNAYFKNLYLGKYILREADISDSSKITAGGRLVSGYKYVDQIEIDFSPPPGTSLDGSSSFYQENAVISVSWDMLNVLELGKIEVQKYGEKPGAPYFDPKTGNLVVPYEEEALEGVVFEVSCENDIPDVNTGEAVWKKGDIAGTFTTDETGYGYLDSLLPGDYALREISAPDGYILTDDKFFTVKVREHIDPFEWYTWDITDARQKLSVVIEKIDDADGKELAGAVFGIYASEDMDLGFIIEKDTLVCEAVSDSNGKACFIDLPPGRYTVRELLPPPGYLINEEFSPEIALSYEGSNIEYLTWTGICTDSRGISVEVDKDTIKRTSAAYVSLPGQAGYNNVGLEEERYRYDIDFRSTSGIWADEFVVDDPLENVKYGKIVVEEIWTPVVWGDYDGLWNLWYATNKTDPNTVYSTASAMDSNPYNPKNPDNTAVYPNTGLKLLAQGLKTDKRYHFTLEDFSLSEGEYLTDLRFEYGRVEVGFTSKNYANESLNGEHRKISGKDLKLPSAAANELMLPDRTMFSGLMPVYTNGVLLTGPGAAGPGLGEQNEMIKSIDGTPIKPDKEGRFKEYITGINGDIVDWTPLEGTRFYAAGAADPGYELMPASYLVSAAKPMEDIDIVSSVSARIARDITMKAYDQDAVVTKEIGTFRYGDRAPKGAAAKTWDEYPLLLLLTILLFSSIGLLLLGRISMDRQHKNRKVTKCL